MPTPAVTVHLASLIARAEAGAACFATNADCWWWMSILGGLLLVRELWTAE